MTGKFGKVSEKMLALVKAKALALAGGGAPDFYAAALALGLTPPVAKWLAAKAVEA